MTEVIDHVLTVPLEPMADGALAECGLWVDNSSDHWGLSIHWPYVTCHTYK